MPYRRQKQFGGEQKLSEYDRFSWQISRYNLLKLGHSAGYSWR